MHDPSIRQQLRHMLQTVIAPLFVDTPITEQRTVLEGMGGQAVLPEGLGIEATTLAGLPAERLSPEGPLVEGRVVLHLHGGGFSMGSCTSHRALAARVGAACRAAVWLPEYRLAPEHPFPAAPDDVLAAYEALLDAGQSPDGIVLSGDSAGGNLALGLAVELVRRGRPLPGALVLMSPFVDLTLAGKSYQTRAEVDPWLDPATFPPICEMYLGDSDADAADPRVSPLFADGHDLARLPPTLIQVGDHEVLLDDARRLAVRMEEAGAAVELQVAPEMWHVWQLFAPMLPEANEALAQIGVFVEQSLGAKAAR